MAYAASKLTSSKKALVVGDNEDCEKFLCWLQKQESTNLITNDRILRRLYFNAKEYEFINFIQSYNFSPMLYRMAHSANVLIVCVSLKNNEYTKLAHQYINEVYRHSDEPRPPIMLVLTDIDEVLKHDQTRFTKVLTYVTSLHFPFQMIIEIDERPCYLADILECIDKQFNPAHIRYYPVPTHGYHRVGIYESNGRKLKDLDVLESPV